VRLTGGNPVRIVLDQNSRLQKRVMYLTIKTIVLQKRQLIPTKKTLPLLSSILKNIATQLTDALYDHQIQSVLKEADKHYKLSLMQICGMKHAFLEELYTSKKALQPH
jgi:riboflavin biosynthesis pyrimidine reductase